MLVTEGRDGREPHADPRPGTNTPRMTSGNGCLGRIEVHKTFIALHSFPQMSFELSSHQAQVWL